MRLLVSFWLAIFAAARVQAQQPPPTPAPSDRNDPASLEGRTVDKGGRPLRKTSLMLRPFDNKPGTAQRQPYATSSDAEGKFAFTAIEPGRYQLSGERIGYPQQIYGSGAKFGRGMVLTLVAGQHMNDLTFELAPQAVISGKVLDEDGDPLQAVRLTVLRQMFVSGKKQLSPMGGSMTDDRGEFRIANLRPGNYYLSATAQRFGYREEQTRPGSPDKTGHAEEDYVTTYFPNVTDLTAATAIQIATGHDLPGTDIQLRKHPVFRVTGKISGGIPGQRLDRLRVTTAAKGQGMFDFFGRAEGGVGKDGSFEVRGLQSGSYVLVTANTQGAFQALGRQEFDVSNGNVEGLVVNLQPPGDLGGVLRIEGRETPEPARVPKNSANAPDDASASVIRVGLIPTDGAGMNGSNASVKDDGSFVLANIGAGRYRVSAFGNPPGTYLKSIRLGTQDVLGSELDLTGGVSGTLEIVFASGAGEISGSVQAGDQKPALGSVVTLIPDTPQPGNLQLYIQSSTDQNGNFVIKNVAPGKYRLFAWEELEPGAMYDSELTNKHESRGTRITVGENGREQTALTVISIAAMQEANQR